MKLSPHFDLIEFTRSETADEHGIDNTPSPAAIANLTKLAATLEEVRALLGGPMKITSGFRCPALNKAAGGVPLSDHVPGFAADFVCPSFGSPLEVARAIAKSPIQFGQIIHEFGRWVHISVNPVARKENRIITIDSHGTRAGLLEIRP